MATVFDVAKYFLNELGEMTTMKLQKLCYYAQAWSLAWDGEPLFEENFQAWANGPVCPELYKAHSGRFKLPEDYFDLANGKFTQDQMDTLKAIKEYYGDKTPQWLSEVTHKETPWMAARGTTPPGERSSEIIPKESMQEYYAGLANS